MARVAIAEPHDDVRELLLHVVERLGHEPVDARGLNGEAPDLLLLEPADASALMLALALRAAQPDLPLVCVSIYPSTPETRALDPEAFLTKPFPLSALEGAVTAALA